MKNQTQWVATKFVSRKSIFRAKASLIGNPAHVNPASRMICDRVGAFYSRVIPKYCHGKLLDLGCGHVPLFGTYVEFVDSITCVDWAESIHANPHLDHIHDLNTPLPLSDNSFDTVILSDVLEHIAQPQSLIAEISRVLRANGIFLMNVPFYYPIHESPYDFHRYTEFALRSLAESNGLEVLELEAHGGGLVVLTDVLLKELASFPVIGRSLATIGHHICNPILKSPLGRFDEERTRERFPYFYTMVCKSS